MTVPERVAVPGQLPPPNHDPDEVRRLAAEVLDDPRYAEPSPSLVDRFWGWVGDRLADLFSLLTEGGGGTALAWLVLAAAVVAVVLVLARARGPLGIGGDRAGPGAEVTVERSRTPEQWRAEAERLRAEGRWADALVCRHRALVGELVDAGVIGEVPGRTAREHLGDVTGSHPGASPPFAEATDAFEATWYGGRPADAAAVDRMAQLEVDVLDHVRRPGRPEPAGATVP